MKGTLSKRRLECARMLKLYNTLTGKKETFAPLKSGEVRMYSCGPTVYHFAHLGNLRAYVFTDTLRRALEYAGYNVNQVMNVTDVGHLVLDADEGEDKMLKALKREGKPLKLEAMREVADTYTRAFVEDMQNLNIEPPQHMPRASEHIKEDIGLIEALLRNGFAYRGRHGIYFDTARFPGYGKLGRINIAGLLAGARVVVNPEKKIPLDFTLWKFSTAGLPAFESPWGKGFPGWHIECSAMSRAYLGQPFDIHTGGIDHIPTHHQNEIAQSEAAFGAPLSRYWLHNEHLIMPAEPASGAGSGGIKKMSKSGDNFITLRALKSRGIRPLAYRYFLLTAHYRSPIAFSFDALLGAQRSYDKLLLAFGRLSGEGRALDGPREKFMAALSDDLNTAAALRVAWETVKNARLAPADRRTTVLDFDRALGLNLETESRKLALEMTDVPEEVKRLAAKREQARAKKSWNEADNIRHDIERAGFEVMDTDAGPVVRRKVNGE